jgi:two-component system NarL family sensor kinase
MNKIDTTIIIVASLSTLIIFLFILMVFFILYEFKKKQIKLKRDIELLNLKHEKNILSAQLEIQEQTLKRIAREIHDNISLSLTLAKLHLNTYEMAGEQGDPGLVRTGIDLIGRSLADLNSLSKSMDAQTIEKFGLVHALESESELVRKSGRLNVSLHIRGEPVRLGSERELHLFRIVQECFNNTLKHAEADSMTVTLDYASDHVRLRVTDDGRGFDPEKARSGKSGSGLRNMENRATILGGTMTHERGNGQGASATITIPHTTSDAIETKDQSGPGR